MAWWRGATIVVGTIVLVLVVPFVIGDALVEHYGKHWWTNLVKMGPSLVAVQVYLRRRRASGPGSRSRP
jgi:hypothetical protein